MAIKQEIITDDKDHQRALAKAAKDIEHLQAKYVKLAVTQKSNAAVSRQQSKDADKDISSQLMGLAKLGVALGAIRSGVGLLQQAYGSWRAEMDKLAESSRKVNDTILGAMKEVGGQLSPEIQAFARRPAGLSSQEERVAAIKAVHEAAPMMAESLKFALASEVARAAPVRDPSQLGALAGEVAEFMPELSARDAVNLSLAAQRRAGDQAGSLADPAFQRTVSLLKKAGYSGEEAIGLGLTALDANVNVKNLEQFAIKGKAKMGDALKARMGLVDFEKGTKLGEDLTRDMQGDLVGTEIAGLARSGVGSEAMEMRRTTRLRELASLNEEARARHIERTREMMTAREREQDMHWLNPVRLIGRGVFEFGALYNDIIGNPLPGAGALDQMPGGRGGGALSEFAQRELEIYTKQLEEMQAMRRELEGMRREQLKGSDVRRDAQAVAPRGAATHTEGASTAGGVSHNK